MISVPIKLLYEAENCVISVELKTGELFRGYLIDVEDTMNVKMYDVFVLVSIQVLVQYFKYFT